LELSSGSATNWEIKEIVNVANYGLSLPNQEPRRSFKLKNSLKLQTRHPERMLYRALPPSTHVSQRLN